MTVNILIGCTGSVASIKLPVLINSLCSIQEPVSIKVVVTEASKHFITKEEVNAEIYDDSCEWSAWKQRGDPVLHIELTKWADIFLIAPLDANTLAKLSHGICDNLVTCTARAWDTSKPLIFCPAMNTKMYKHPLTDKQIKILVSWGYLEISAIEKTLICGDTGVGAMAEVTTIVTFIQNIVKEKLNCIDHI